MVVFLLLLILAVLLFGAAAVKGFFMGLLQLAGAVLLLAVAVGVWNGVPWWCWLLLATVIATVIVVIAQLAAKGAREMVDANHRNDRERRERMADLVARVNARRAMMGEAEIKAEDKAVRAMAKQFGDDLDLAND